MKTYTTHPFLTVGKLRLSSYAPKGYLGGQPSLAYSGSVSFDAVVNQPRGTTASHSADFSVFRMLLDFFDEEHAFLHSYSFEVRLQLSPEVNLEVTPPQVSNKVRLRAELRSDKASTNRSVSFNIREAASCSDDDSVGLDLSNESLSRKLRSLNYFQVLSKLTLFYTVGYC